MIKSIFLSLVLLATVTAAEKFTIVIIPDTQFPIQTCPSVTDSQFSWIARHKDSLNIKYVMHVGDVTDGSTTAAWTNASEAVRLIENAGIPYIICAGNHDFNGGTLSNFTTAFPVSRLQTALQKTSYAQWGGSFPEGLSDNSYHLFSAGAVNWVVLSLKYDAGSDTAIMTWANSVATTFADRKLILVTHDYLTGSGTRSTAGGTPLWNNLINRHNNFLFVVCGHTMPVSRRTSTTSLGNSVYEMLTDWQNTVACSYDNSITRILEFDTQNRQVAAWTLSPPDNRRLTDAANQFALTNIDFGTLVAIRPEGDRTAFALPASVAGVNEVRIYALNGKLIRTFENSKALCAAEKQMHLHARSGLYLVAMFRHGIPALKRDVFLQ
jgi:hypothetical protein